MIEVEVPMIPGKSGMVPPLTANQRLHWRAKADRVEGIRSVVAWRVKALKLAPQEHVTVRLVFRPGVNRKRDASNLMPTQKAAVDGLVSAGLVPDDDARFVTELMPVILPASEIGPARMWLEIEPAEEKAE